MNNKHYIKCFLFVACVALSVVIFSGCDKRQRKKESAWPLRGTEVLLELQPSEHCKCKYAGGIYAFDLSVKKPEPRLLIKEGRNPLWVSTRDRFVYLRNDSIWVASISGKNKLVLEHGGLYPGSVCRTSEWSYEGRYLLSERTLAKGTIALSPLRLSGPLPREQQGVPWPSFRMGQGGNRLEPAIREWRDILSVKSMDFSPDGKKIAAEISPLAPSDLLRKESRIYVCDRRTRHATWPSSPTRWALNLGPINQGKIRLTSLVNETCELRPLWSPNGDWIAFTVVHFKEGYVAPAVCRPDGSHYTELLPNNARELGPFNGTGDGWGLVQPLDLTKSDNVYPMFGWGQPNLWPVEWSDDGAYLLLNGGEPFASLLIAKYEKGKWWIKGARGSGVLAGNSAALGPSKHGSCMLAVADDGNLGIIDAAEVRNGSPKTRIILMPPGALIRGLDW